ncbi:helix-turn-helix transcriptional regulator [Williamsia deligens]|uniref:Helix-turn-helix transcriptional regulator n=1 Tax=Williamsia deligens TaxID=321325 RepID=A0ABW3GFE6_9NOCA|nr:metalloregulator ArsR/SmtB family transcription factor [Williamsia deligens]
MKTSSADARSAEPHVTIGAEGQTRSAVIALLLEHGPCTASEIGDALGVSAGGVRRHLEALIADGRVTSGESSRYARRGRGRPAKQFRLTSRGRGGLPHAYDDLAGAAMRRLRDIGGDAAVRAFAADRIGDLVTGVEPTSPERAESDPDAVERTAGQIAEALTRSGYSADTRRVGNGVQICQHHCPVGHVATEFPELCEAETERFTALLGTHVQRLATIANGDCACTTHVPLTSPTSTGAPAGDRDDRSPGPGRDRSSPAADVQPPSPTATTHREDSDDRH